MSKRLLATVLCAFLVATVGSAQKPEKDISAKRHPNLAAAQRFSRQAWEKVVAAQQANEWDMNGHAQRAKDLIVQASDEIAAAAGAANANAH